MDNGFKIRNGANLGSLSADPSNPQNGDIYYSTSLNKFRHYVNGNWDNLVGEALSQALSNKQLGFSSADDTSTGSSATLGSFTSGILRVTSGSLVSIGGIPAGTSGQFLVLENKTGIQININNEDSGATASNRIQTGTSSNVAMPNNSTFMFTYDSTSARWQLSGGSGSGSGSGGSKNYLSAITTSQSTTPNTGNGNFELGSTTGWSLGTVGTLTNGIPTGSPTFGSGASGNLSFSIISSGQLAASYSGSYVSSAATTQGNMLASDAFFIDTEDQSKVLTWKIYYKAASGASNANWSGTSSNSFGIAIYDVTNSSWLSTTANFGLTQSSGVGTATGTCQTNSTTTQLRFVLYNANATSGAITLNVDDIFVGPQTIPIGYAGGDWTAYTPTLTGVGTATNVNCFYRRLGSSVDIMGYFTCGTTTAAAVSITLPSGMSINTSAIGTNTNVQMVGDSSILASGTNVAFTAATGGVSKIFFDGSTTGSVFLTHEYNSNAFAKPNGSVFLASGNIVTFRFLVPVAGWSSNVQMSSDTDTRVVAARYHVSTGASTTANTTPINYDTLDIDTHSAVTTGVGTWKFTCPVSGVYDVSIVFYASTQSGVQLYKNGSEYSTIANNNTGTNAVASGSTLISLVAGDFIDARVNVTTTPSASAGASTTAQSNSISIKRLSGPSVIAATESVNMTVTTSTTAATTSTPFIFTSVQKDSHGAYSVSTGKYAVPVSGQYRITAQAVASSVTTADIDIYKNGSKIISGQNSGSVSGYTVSASWPFLTGDTIEIRPSTSITANGSATANYLMIDRIGN